MFENFRVPSNVSIAGYRWDCENPQKVLCIIHGIGEYQGRYDRVAKAFNAEGIAVLGMDHRGHGLSEGTRGHAAPRREVLSDIDALITYTESNFPGLPIIMYGHSMGGNIMLDYRIRGNKSRIPSAYIISAPWIKLYKPFPKAVVSFAHIMAKVKPELQISSRIDEKILGNPLNVRGYYKDPFVHSYITAACAADGFDVGKALYENKLEGNFGGRGKPLLLMHGDADMICDVSGSRAVAAYEPNCRYIEWQGYYHEIHNGGPLASGDEVIKTAVEFVKSI
ncbi:MAG: alpha/beta hydrolase [Firmicutes bacterium]|nr:alpha/beta hydrolase [Bacillota bacterium]